MSATCQAQDCFAVIPEDHFACGPHWLRLSHTTRSRLLDKWATAEGYLDVLAQAEAEMRLRPHLLTGRMP